MNVPFRLTAMNIFAAGLVAFLSGAGAAGSEPRASGHRAPDGEAAPAAPLVKITAETPSVDVAPARTTRQFVDLPALEYAFEVETRCRDGWSPESLSVSVADTRVAVGARQLADNAHQSLVLRIPARQLAPVAVHDFCQIAPASPTSAAKRADDSPRTLKAVLSANASLRCRSDTEQAIVYQTIAYASQLLDVILNCRANGSAGAAVRPGDAYGALLPIAR